MTVRITLVTAVTLALSVIAQQPPKTKPEAKKDAEPNIAQATERIADNASKAGDRLKVRDVGEDTRTIQEDILRDLDVLIRKAQEPPPPPKKNDMPPPKSDMPPPPMKNDTPPPMNKENEPNPSKSRMPKSGVNDPSSIPMPNPGTSKDNPSRPERKNRRRDSPSNASAKRELSEVGPMPAEVDLKEPPKKESTNQSTPAAKKDDFGKKSPPRRPDALAELYKDVWGHLPDRLRQEMDLYYREQFMPRYSELLRQYYSALAEQQKKGADK